MFLFLLPMLAFAPPALQAQTAADMETMLGSDTVSTAAAARFVLGAADLLTPGLSGSEAERAAYEMASSRGWVKASAGDAISMEETAFLVMKAFDLKGGLMYSLFKNPRYAYREMVYRKLIPGQTYQGTKVSGAKLLQILDKTVTNEE